MIVVFGVAHYGKGNRVDRHDNCEHCGVFGRLSSYDAGAFFTIYWIPLLPLGRKRVIDSCPSCKKRREIGLGKYQKMKKQELGEAVANMKSRPDDADKAIEGVQAFIRHNDFVNFEAMAAVLGKKHANNAKVMNTLGSAYEYMGRLDPAEACYRQAVNNANTPENVVDLVRVLLLDHKVQEAEPYFQPIFAGQQPKNVGLIYLLVDAYREQGHHAKALEALERIEKLDPRLAQEQQHADLVKTSTDRLESGNSIPSSLLNRPRGVQTSKGSSPWIPTLVLPGIVILVVATYLFACYGAGLACPMWLVNGTDVAYTVNINDKRYKLGPHSRDSIEIPQGEIRMAIEGSPLPVAPATVNVNTPFFSRPFASRSIVLNPDAQAILVKQRNTYSTHEMGEQEMPYTLHAGKELHVFKGIDYEFAEFPKEISTDSSAATIHKWRLYNLLPEKGVSLFDIAVQAFEQPELILGYLRKRALLYPDNATALTLYCSVGMANPAEDVFAILKQGTARRPLLVDWHRMYQAMAERSLPDHDVISEYRALQTAEPEDRELMYLFGRILKDRAEAKKWFEKSEQGERPVGFGYAALCFGHYCLGEFAEAAELLEKALEIKPDREQWQSQYRTLLLGAGRYDDLLDLVRKNRKAEPVLGVYALEEVSVLVRAGRVGEARKVTESYLALLKTEDPEALEGWETLIKGTIAYATGDFGVYRECYRESEAPSDAFALALVDEDTTAMQKALTEIEMPSYFQHLLAYCVMASKGESEPGAEQLNKALEALSEGTPEHRTVAGMLRGDAGLVREQLGPMHVESYEKRVFAAAIGLAVPETRDHCFVIARRHNFDHSFPYQTIARVTAARAAGGR
ncbi:tetratricopeptide repeat protein [Verrucomicrobiota bacterium]